MKLRFGRDFEFDVVDLTLKHSIIGFVTLLVLECSQSFVVVVYVVYVVFVVVIVVVLVYFAILIMWWSIMLMSMLIWQHTGIFVLKFLCILCIGAMSNFLHNIDSQDGPKGLKDAGAG